MTYWTKKKPTKPGWYWKKDWQGSEIIKVRDYVGVLCILNWAIPDNIEWAGPIPLPMIPGCGDVHEYYEDET